MSQLHQPTEDIAAETVEMEAGMTRFTPPLTTESIAALAADHAVLRMQVRRMTRDLLACRRHVSLLIDRIERCVPMTEEDRLYFDAAVQVERL